MKAIFCLLFSASLLLAVLAESLRPEGPGNHRVPADHPLYVEQVKDDQIFESNGMFFTDQVPESEKGFQGEIRVPEIPRRRYPRWATCGLIFFQGTGQEVAAKQLLCDVCMNLASPRGNMEEMLNIMYGVPYWTDISKPQLPDELEDGWTIMTGLDPHSTTRDVRSAFNLPLFRLENVRSAFFNLRRYFCKDKMDNDVMNCKPVPREECIKLVRTVTNTEAWEDYVRLLKLNRPETSPVPNAASKPLWQLVSTDLVQNFDNFNLMVQQSLAGEPDAWRCRTDDGIYMDQFAHHCTESTVKCVEDAQKSAACKKSVHSSECTHAVSLCSTANKPCGAQGLEGRCVVYPKWIRERDSLVCMYCNRGGLCNTVVNAKCAEVGAFCHNEITRQALEERFGKKPGQLSEAEAEEFHRLKVGSCRIRPTEVVKDSKFRSKARVCMMVDNHYKPTELKKGDIIGPCFHDLNPLTNQPIPVGSKCTGLFPNSAPYNGWSVSGQEIEHATCQELNPDNFKSQLEGSRVWGPNVLKGDPHAIAKMIDASFKTDKLLSGSESDVNHAVNYLQSGTALVPSVFRALKAELMPQSDEKDFLVVKQH
eukprot:GILI01005171.1.p1 GENE.GILI01005171.1~~GILI01005171.1.p1  ORF type:complete len:593 (+),score=148.42 GILI01005171.1:61-1839(+)